MRWSVCGLYAVCMALALSACCPRPVPEIRYVTQRVEVPVPVPCPVPREIDRPSLPIEGLRVDSPPADVLRAYAATVVELQGYALELEMVLEGYRPSGKEPARAPLSGGDFGGE